MIIKTIDNTWPYANMFENKITFCFLFPTSNGYIWWTGIMEYIMPQPLPHQIDN